MLFTFLLLFTHQYGVPTKELAGEAIEAEPKSASLTWPGSVSKTLPAFTSLREKKKHQSRGIREEMYCFQMLFKTSSVGYVESLTCGSYCGNEGRPGLAEHRV